MAPLHLRPRTCRHHRPQRPSLPPASACAGAHSLAPWRQPRRHGMGHQRRLHHVHRTRAYLLRLNSLLQRTHQLPCTPPLYPWRPSTPWRMTPAGCGTSLTMPCSLILISANPVRQTSWRICQLPPDLLHAVTGALSRQRYVPASLRTAAPAPGRLLARLGVLLRELGHDPGLRCPRPRPSSATLCPQVPNGRPCPWRPPHPLSDGGGRRTSGGSDVLPVGGP
jgi:hypothetical protein